jgi:type VI secretion system protein VasJ
MLGMNPQGSLWRWSAWGKHPSFRDYFDYRVDLPLLRAFAGWVESGALEKAALKKAPTCFSYRFWTRGTSTDNLICGILRDSGDSFGRPYPLLIMGNGSIPGWNRNWDMTFQAFDATLSRFETLSANSFENFRRFEQELQGIVFSSVHWFRVRAEMEADDPGERVRSFQGLSRLLRGTAGQSRKQESLTLCLGSGIRNEALPWSSRWGRGLFGRTPPGPHSAFMGGSLERPVLKLFNRPLTAGDFCALFDASVFGITEEGV